MNSATTAVMTKTLKLTDGTTVEVRSSSGGKAWTDKAIGFWAPDFESRGRVYWVGPKYERAVEVG